MATVKELKATARPKSGKGAARAERRAGRVPGVIYGDNQPPVTISVDDRDLRQRILAGRFLTTLFDIELEGKKHRVIPRDYHLDPVKDFPIHVDFMRLGEGATFRVTLPLVAAHDAPAARILHWPQHHVLLGTGDEPRRRVAVGRCLQAQDRECVRVHGAHQRLPQRTAGRARVAHHLGHQLGGAHGDAGMFQ